MGEQGEWGEAPPVARPSPGTPDYSWQLVSEESPFWSQQLRLLFHFAGVEFEDRRLNEAEVHACRSDSARDASPLPLDELPIVTHGPNTLATIGGAMQYVGETVGLGCEPVPDRSRALMVIIGCVAMRREAFFPAVDKMCETWSRITSFPMESYNKWFGHYERYLRVSAAKIETPGTFHGPFIFGKELCYADLALYDVCTAIIELGCYGRDEAERAGKFPRLCALLEAVKSDPRMATYERRYGRPHAEALRSIGGDLPPAPPPSGKAAAPVWEVVGGGEAGGLLVRAEKSTSSKAEAERLATGSLVKQLEIDGERVRYERLTGSGPNTGWVSSAVKGKELLRSTVKRPYNPPMRGRDLPPPPKEGEWRVIYYVNASRGQQLRLQFHFAGIPFEDKRLSDEDVQFYKSRFARDDSPLAYDFVPIVQHGDLNMCSAAGALQYIAETLGNGSDDTFERSKMTMLIVLSEQMRNEVVYTIYHPMRKSKKRVGYFDPGPYHMWLSRFERYLRTAAADAESVGVDAAETGPFVFGKKMMYVDLVLYDCLTFIIDLGCYGRDEAARAQQYPRVCALVEAVERHPNLEKYGRPHAEDLILRVGRLPPPRSPSDEPPLAPPPLPRRELLQKRLADVDAAMQEAGGVEQAPDRRSGVEVIIGGSKLIEDQPGLIEQLVEMINSSYAESVKNNPHRTEHKTQSYEDIYGRLSIGDHGTRNNRVLHVAYMGKKVVGCCSSSFYTPWHPKGIGQWGLLAVDKSAQGKGVASALVSSAMRRLAQRCDGAVIEYTFTSNDPFSERLKAWYDGKLGFTTTSAQPVGRSTTFQVGRRDFTPEEKARGRVALLREQREEIKADLRAVDEDPSTAGDGLNCREVFKKMRAFVQAKGLELAPHICSAFQFDILDAGPEGKFHIDLRPDMVCAWHGEDHTADVSVQTSDSDLMCWLDQSLSGEHAYWSGRAVVTDPDDKKGALFWVYGEACREYQES